MSETNNRVIPPNGDEEEQMRRMAHTATISLAVILGQMWQEHKTIDTEERPVEFAISLRSLPNPKPAEEGQKRIAFFRAEAMWVQNDKTYHAHGPAFTAEQLNEGINITTMFRSIAEGMRDKQKRIEAEAQ